MKLVTRAWTSVLLLTALAGCEEPAATSDTIVIRLSGIKEDDIREGVVEKEKNVTTEVSNPYAQFLADARAALGTDPTSVEVEAVTLTLAGDSRGVLGFEDVFSGEVNAFLRTDDGGTVYIGRVDRPTGVGPVECEIVADTDALAPILPSLLDGVFRVGVRGATDRVATDDFEAKIEVAVQFSAYE
jgi:hypothetical protein